MGSQFINGKLNEKHENGLSNLEWFLYVWVYICKYSVSFSLCYPFNTIYFICFTWTFFFFCLKITLNSFFFFSIFFYNNFICEDITDSVRRPFISKCELLFVYVFAITDFYVLFNMNLLLVSPKKQKRNLFNFNLLALSFFTYIKFNHND